MLESIPEKALREHVARAKLHPEGHKRDARIYRAIRHIIDYGSIFYVLADTPGQSEDYFSILVDDRMILDFELERNNPEARPQEIEQRPVEKWRKAASKLSDAKLTIALEMARQDLAS